MSRQIYISGALTNSDRKEFYETIGKVVEKAGYIPYIPHLHTDPKANPDVTPEEVYEIDMNVIDNSCMVIAYVGSPSLGVGAELEHASQNMTPIILLYEKGAKVSRLAKGIPMVNTILEYENEQEAIDYISKYLPNMPMAK